MTEGEEQAWGRGREAAWRHLLKEAVSELGLTGSTVAQLAELLDERARAMCALRGLCQEYGISDIWPEELDLADVIQKHVARGLEAAAPAPDTEPVSGRDDDPTIEPWGHAR